MRSARGIHKEHSAELYFQNHLLLATSRSGPGVQGAMRSKTKRAIAALLISLLVILLPAWHLKSGQWKPIAPKLYYQRNGAHSATTVGDVNTKIHTKSPLNMTSISSASNSVATVIDGNRTLRVGDTLLVIVEMRGFTGRAKRHGGDFIFARMFNKRLGAAASGVVTDRGDGSYAVEFRVSWPGESRLHMALVHASEAVAVLERTREVVRDKVSFWGTFVSEKQKRTVYCHVFLNTTGKEICDFTDARLGESWMCEKPGQMPCYALQGYSSYNKYAHIFTDEERQLFSREHLHVPIPLQYTVQAEPSNDENPKRKCTPGLGLSSPSGHYFKNVWQSSMCEMRHFDTPENVTDCLRHKEVYLFGDSTIRQYWEFLNGFVKDLKRFDLQKPGLHQPRLAIDNDNNILLQWFCHAYPLVTASYTYKEDVQYIANRIDAMSGGRHVAVGICLGAHFTIFPLEVFHKRMENIGEAVRKLLLRSPDTKVIVKLANTHDSYNLEMFSNWNTFRMNEITLEVFKELNVAFIDAWDMTLSINSAQLHPTEHIVKNQVDLFLSYIC